MERSFGHAVTLYDAMTPDSRERVIGHFDAMLATYAGEDIRVLFARAVDIEFSEIEQRMLREKQAEGMA
jgi:hypothetical protein